MPHRVCRACRAFVYSKRTLDRPLDPIAGCVNTGRLTHANLPALVNHMRKFALCTWMRSGDVLVRLALFHESEVMVGDYV
jgi:hypothetical protein